MRVNHTEKKKMKKLYADVSFFRTKLIKLSLLPS